MKKIVCLVLAATLAVFFCACERKSDAQKAIEDSGLGKVMQNAEKNINEAYEKTENAIEDALDEIK